MRITGHKRVLLGRHGETTSNRDGLIMGQSDSPLTEKGLRTAAEMAGRLEQEKIGTIFSSPLGRAARTAKIYADRLGLPVASRDVMAELSCGRWEGKSRRQVLGSSVALRKDWDEIPPGGESCADGEARVAPLISEIRSLDVQAAVLVVGHASVNRVFLKLWLGLHPGVAIRIACPHDTVYVLKDAELISAMSAAGKIVPNLLFEED